MYSLTFCICIMLPERHQWKPAVQAAAVMLRTPPVDGQPATPTFHIWRAILRMPPSPASHRPAAHTHPTKHSHYVVISRDGRKLVTRVHVILTYHSNATHALIANPPNSAQLGGSLYYVPKLHPGPCSSVAADRQTDRQTDTQTHVTTIHFVSSTTHAKCNHPKLSTLENRPN